MSSELEVRATESLKEGDEITVGMMMVVVVVVVKDVDVGEIEC